MSWLKDVIRLKSVRDQEKLQVLSGEKKIANSDWDKHEDSYRYCWNEWTRLKVDSAIIDVNENLFKGRIKGPKVWFHGDKSGVSFESNFPSLKQGQLAKILTEKNLDSNIILPECSIEEYIFHTKSLPDFPNGEPNAEAILDFEFSIGNGEIRCDHSSLGRSEDYRGPEELRLKISEVLLKRFSK